MRFLITFTAAALNGEALVSCSESEVAEKYLDGQSRK
jgi:hypothetical protein